VRDVLRLRLHLAAPVLVGVAIAAASTRGKPGIPNLSCGGKYVPAKNGRWSGVRNTVSGQPPERPMSCTTSW
jgi:hypothetical protein